MCMALIKPATGEGMDKSTLVHSQIQIIIFHFLPSPNPSHTQWIINFVLDSIHTQSIICTLLTPYPAHFFNG
jgi:hypothetical protein